VSREHLMLLGHPSRRYEVIEDVAPCVAAFRDALFARVRSRRSQPLASLAFSARFSRVVGEAPLQYLTRWRIHRAMGWLREGRAGLSEVAERVGYESEAAFSKAFKRHVGVAPGAWRRSLTSAPLPAAS
jgi:hypothetical protein